MFIGLFSITTCTKQEAPSVIASAEPGTTSPPTKPATPTIRRQKTVAAFSVTFLLIDVFTAINI
jgi:hypothetical protein